MTTTEMKASVGTWAWVRLGAIIALAATMLTAAFVSQAYGTDPDGFVPAAIAVASGVWLATVLAFSLYLKDRPQVSPGVTSRVSRLGRSATGGRTNDELVVDFGRVVRFLFFAGTHPGTPRPEAGDSPWRAL